MVNRMQILYEYINKIRRKRAITSILLQGILFVIVLYACFLLLHSTQTNLENLGIDSGFSFLSHEAGFSISDSLIEYNATYSYGYAFIVGIVNTLFVCSIAIIMTTILGVIVGISRVSNNWLVAKLASIYVEVIRNIPLLLTLLFIYFVVLKSLPGTRDPVSPIEGVYLTLRGMYIPKPIFESGIFSVLIVAIISIITVLLFLRGTKKNRLRIGQKRPVILISTMIILIPIVVTYYVTGSPMDFEFSELKGFNYKGGISFKPEFMALLIGLVLYTAAYIGENVRSGLESVPKGQIEASRALGVPIFVTISKILLPQALRVAIPATTNDYASLVKNSSLAIAIGFPDMVSVGGTVMGQNGQAIEVVAIWMCIYLTINITISFFMNKLNSSIQVVER